MATALHSTLTRFTDKCGKPLAGGAIFTYAVGTTTQKVTYTDSQKTAVNTNPVILDALGQAHVFLDGAYRVRVLDRNGVLVEDIEYIESWLTESVKDQVFASVDERILAETDRAEVAEQVLKNQIDTEKSRAETAEILLKNDITAEIMVRSIADNALQAQINSIGGGKKAYLTYSLMVADKANIAAKSSIDVTNDSDITRNGTYTYDGTTFTKSAYDALQLAKDYVNGFATFKTKSIEVAMDYNSLTEAGLHYVQSASIAAANTNCPVTEVHAVQVFKASPTHCIQLVTTRNSKMYIRGSAGSTITWTNWEEFLSSANFGSYFNAIATETFKAKTLDSIAVESSLLANANPTTGQIIRQTGEIASGTGYDGWALSDLIPVSPGQVISYQAQATNIISVISTFDKDKNFIEPFVKTASASLNTISGTVYIPENVAYIRLCYYNANNVFSFKTRAINKAYLPQTSVGTAAHRYKGQVLMTLGDSITDHRSNPYTYPPIVANYFGMTLVDGAMAGRRIRNAFVRNTVVTDAAIQAASIITIAHGTNDFKLETSLGAITDTATTWAQFQDPTYTDTTNQTDGTFYADYKGVIERLLSVNPKARIMLITPIRRTQAAATGTDTNAKGFKLKAYADAVKIIGEYYGLPVLDNYNTSGINERNMSTVTSDGLHPTAETQANILAPKIIGFIESN